MGELHRGFPPVAAPGATRLVLGNMPGVASLDAAEYYAHPRNAFWPILGRLAGSRPEWPYARRTAALRRAGIALWDVIRSCEREGSLDRSIVRTSIVVNDFASFFAAHPGIRAVFCNGGAAYDNYRRLVLPRLQGPAAGLPLTRLPSTSPAHAALSFERKLKAWRALNAGEAPRAGRG